MFTNNGCPFGAVVKCELVTQKVNYIRPRKILTPRIAYSFVRVESSFGKSNFTVIFSFFLRANVSPPNHIFCSSLDDQTMNANIA